MFGTVTAIIVLYVIGLLVGRRYDKKDREKVSNFVSTMRFTMDALVYCFHTTVFECLTYNGLVCLSGSILTEEGVFFSKSSRPLIKGTMTVRSGTWLNGLYK